jgi:hypothetical protein
LLHLDKYWLAYTKRTALKRSSLISVLLPIITKPPDCWDGDRAQGLTANRRQIEEAMGKLGLNKSGLQNAGVAKRTDPGGISTISGIWDRDTDGMGYIRIHSLTFLREMGWAYVRDVCLQAPTPYVDSCFSANFGRLNGLRATFSTISSTTFFFQDIKISYI